MHDVLLISTAFSERKRPKKKVCVSPAIIDMLLIEGKHSFGDQRKLMRRLRTQNGLRKSVKSTLCNMLYSFYKQW